MGQLDANDQSVVRIVDWLLQYAFEQRASDIPLSNRGANSPMYAFVSTACCIRCIKSLARCITQFTSRIKLLGRMDMVEKRRPGKMAVLKP